MRFRAVLLCSALCWTQSPVRADGVSHLPPHDSVELAGYHGCPTAQTSEAGHVYPCTPCCNRAGCYFEPEVLFLKYHREDGVAIGTDPGESESFSFLSTPRISFGYRRGDGLGTRLRWFRFDQFRSIEDAVDRDGIGVNAQNIDMEVFDNFQLTPFWSAEVSGGIRYCDFEETIVDVDDAIARVIDFHSIGLILGLELNRQIAPGHALFGRLRASLQPGDKELGRQLPVPELSVFKDVNQAIVELSLGYEVNHVLPSGILLFARGGYEMQDWLRYSARFDDAPASPLSNGHADVGFSGFFFSLGATR